MKNPDFDFNKTMQEIIDNECVMSALLGGLNEKENC